MRAVYTPREPLKIDHVELVTPSPPLGPGVLPRLLVYVGQDALGPEEPLVLALSPEQAGRVLALWAAGARAGQADLTVED